MAVPNPFHWLAESLFGFDYFISYSWRERSAYAERLHSALQARGMRCFLDRSPEGFTAGGGLKAETARATRHSSALVVVADRHAFGSRYVPHEVVFFERAKRLIIPIDVHDTIARARLDPSFASTLTPNSEAAAMLAALIDKVGPKESADQADAPSQEVIDKLVSSFQYTRRMARRVRAFGAFTAIFAGVAVLAVVFMLLATRRAHQSESRRLIALAEATPTSLPKQEGRLDVPEIFPQRKVLLATEAIRATLDHGEPVLPEAENALREALRSVHGLGLMEQPSSVTALAVAPDGAVATAGNDGRIRYWNLGGPALRDLVLGSHGDQVTGLAFTPDGHIVTSGYDGTVRVWDPKAPRPAPRILSGHEGRVLSLTFTPSGQLATGGMDGRVLTWDLNRPVIEPAELVKQEGPVEALTFAPEGYLVTGGAFGRLRVWYRPGPKSSKPSREIVAHRVGGVTAVAFTGDGRIVSCGQDGSVSVRDLDVRNNIRDLGSHVGAISALALAPDGRVATAGVDRTVRVWDLDPKRTPAQDRHLVGHDGEVTSLGFTPDGRLLSGSRDGTVRSWDLDDPAIEPSLLHAHQVKVTAISFLADGRLATAAVDGMVRIWDLTRLGSPPEELPPDDDRRWVSKLLGLPDGRLIVSDRHGGLKAWSLIRDEPRIQALSRGPEGSVQALLLGADGWLYASEGARVWAWRIDRPDERPIRLAGKDDQGFITSLAYSTPYRILMARQQDWTLEAWDVSKTPPVPIALPKSIRDSTAALAFADDGRLVAARSADEVVLWDPNHPQHKPIMLGHGGGLIEAMAVAPGGRLLVSGTDGMLRSWDLSRSRPRSTRVVATRVEDKVAAMVLSSANMAVSPDGKRAVVQRGGSGTLEIWELGINHLLDVADRGAGRNLSGEEWLDYFPERDYRPTFPTRLNRSHPGQ